MKDRKEEVEKGKRMGKRKGRRGERRTKIRENVEKGRRGQRRRDDGLKLIQKISSEVWQERRDMGETKEGSEIKLGGKKRKE